VVFNEVLVHFVCNIFVCTGSVMGGSCGIHVSNDEGGTFFFSLVMVVICACISELEACASGVYPLDPSVRVSNPLPGQCFCVHKQSYPRFCLCE